MSVSMAVELHSHHFGISIGKCVQPESLSAQIFVMFVLIIVFTCVLTHWQLQLLNQLFLYCGCDNDDWINASGSTLQGML